MVEANLPRPADPQKQADRHKQVWNMLRQQPMQTASAGLRMPRPNKPEIKTTQGRNLLKESRRQKSTNTATQIASKRKTFKTRPAQPNRYGPFLCCLLLGRT